MRRLARPALASALSFVASLVVATSGAQAVVVDMGAPGHFGVALVPGTDPAKTGLKLVKSTSPCTDPALTQDLFLRSTGLCYNGGAVLPSNESFALTWDPGRSYWASTRNFVEHFLRDVADASRALSTPYAVTTQYTDKIPSAGGTPPTTVTHRAGSQDSFYGGGCIDYGTRGGATCKFNDTVASGPGNDYPSDASGCSVKSVYASLGTSLVPPCLTDAQIQAQLSTTVQEMGLINHIQPGSMPMLVMLTPPDVEVCLDKAGTACSANVDPKSGKLPTAQFCSYHGQMQIGNRTFTYVVQPWTAWTNCDEPGLPKLTNVAVDAGTRLVSPLSAGQIATIVNPGLNAWYGTDGSEINDHAITDNGLNSGPCRPRGQQLDAVTVGSSGQNPYVLQPESNNAGAIETDPNAPTCAMGVALSPTFVVPSPLDQGDVVAFDGSVTVSTLMVPKLSYQWDFGDGVTALGPSVVHVYAKGGTYKVTLRVIDRGDNTASITQTIQVLDANGQVVTPSSANARLLAHMQLLPESLGSILRSGIAMRVSSNQAADGIATVSISRATARRAHIRYGRGATVVIGRGTVSGIRNGTVSLRVRLSGATASKLRRLGHVSLTIRLVLVSASGARLATDVAGRY